MKRLKILKESTKKIKKKLKVLKRKHELHVEEVNVTMLVSESKICIIKRDIRKLKEIFFLYKSIIKHLLKMIKNL